jgi:hypothetical protein
MTDLRWMLEKATVRLEILLGRMRACGEGRGQDHNLSLLEGTAWLEEQREALRWGDRP